MGQQQEGELLLLLCVTPGSPEGPGSLWRGSLWVSCAEEIVINRMFAPVPLLAARCRPRSGSSGLPCPRPQLWVPPLALISVKDRCQDVSIRAETPTGLISLSHKTAGAFLGSRCVKPLLCRASCGSAASPVLRPRSCTSRGDCRGSSPCGTEK